jgi:hypothetical protein
MNTKEKAQELFDKYYQIFEDDEDEHFIGTSKRISKLSALIAVDEILNVLEIPEQNIEREFWYEVKQFIEEI